MSQTPKQQEFLYKLSGFDFKIEYTPRKENIVTDNMSRRDEMVIEEGSFLALRAHINEITSLLRKEQNCNDTIRVEILLSKKEGLLFKFVDGLLFFKEKLWIPNGAQVIAKLWKPCMDHY